MGRNIIFLDIDGVLNSMPYFDKQNHSPPDGKHHEIRDYHLQQLSQIVHTCNAQIVLSSTWRELDDILDDPSAYSMRQYLTEALADYDMYIFDKTPIIHFNRPLEIATWLRAQPDKDTLCFISLDDDFTKAEYDAYGIGGHLIQTQFFCQTMEEGGLQQKHVKQAIALFERQEKERKIIMERLIDTQSLKDRVSEYTLNEDEYERFCRIISAEPTAYDPDKVAEQLEEFRDEMKQFGCDGMLSDMIDVVKYGYSPELTRSDDELELL